jgi:hypothetical protein
MNQLSNIQQFLSQRTIVHPETMTNSSLLYGAYHQWCLDQNIIPVSQKMFSQILRKQLNFVIASQWDANYFLTIRLNTGQSIPIYKSRQPKTQAQKREANREHQRRYRRNHRTEINERKGLQRRLEHEEAEALGLTRQAYGRRDKSKSLRVVRCQGIIDPVRSKLLMTLITKQLELRTAEIAYGHKNRYLDRDMNLRRGEISRETQVNLTVPNTSTEPIDPAPLSEHQKALQRRLELDASQLSRDQASLDAKRRDIDDLKRQLIQLGIPEDQFNQVRINLNVPSLASLPQEANSALVKSNRPPPTHSVSVPRPSSNGAGVILATDARSQFMGQPKVPKLTLAPPVTLPPSAPGSVNHPPPEPSYTQGSPISDDLILEFRQWRSAWESNYETSIKDPTMVPNSRPLQQLKSAWTKVNTRYLEIEEAYLEQMDPDRPISNIYLAIAEESYQREKSRIESDPDLTPSQRLARLDTLNHERQETRAHYAKFH